MHRTGLLAIVSLLGCLAVTAASAQEAATSGTVGRIEATTGAVKVVNAVSKQERIAAVGLKVLYNDVISTGKGAKATLVLFDDNTEVIVLPETTIAVNILYRAGERTQQSLGLFLGRISVKVKKVIGNKAELTVNAGAATAGVRGTEFGVAVPNGTDAWIGVHSGVVEVTGTGAGGGIEPLARLEKAKQIFVGRDKDPLVKPFSGAPDGVESWFAEGKKNFELEEIFLLSTMTNVSTDRLGKWYDEFSAALAAAGGKPGLADRKALELKCRLIIREENRLGTLRTALAGRAVKKEKRILETLSSLAEFEAAARAKRAAFADAAARL